MSNEKYIGLDVHQATISVAVMDSQGKVVMESILETKASTILEFFAGLRGSLFVTFEEGTWAAWLYDLLKPHVTEVLVCNPRKIPLLKQGFQPIHDPGKIFDYGQITPRQLAQHAYPVFAVVHGLEVMEAQSLGKFASIDPVTLVALFEQWDLARIAHQHLGHMRLEQIV